MEKTLRNELKRLGVPRIFVVSFDTKGRHEIKEGVESHIYDVAQDCILFYFLKGGWTVSYVDENKNIHPEYIAKYGFRITVDGSSNLCLYKDKELKEQVPLNGDDFVNCFENIYSSYIEEIQLYSYDNKLFSAKN